MWLEDNLLDLIFIGMLLLGAVIASIKGFVRELTSVFAWVLTTTLCLHFAGPAQSLFKSSIKSQAISHFLGLLLSFGLCFIIIFFASAQISKAISKNIPSFTNKALGVVFGIFKTYTLFAFVLFLIIQVCVPEENTAKFTLSKAFVRSKAVGLALPMLSLFQVVSGKSSPFWAKANTFKQQYKSLNSEALGKEPSVSQKRADVKESVSSSEDEITKIAVEQQDLQAEKHSKNYNELVEFFGDKSLYSQIQLPQKQQENIEFILKTIPEKFLIQADGQAKLYSKNGKKAADLKGAFLALVQSYRKARHIINGVEIISDKDLALLEQFISGNARAISGNVQATAVAPPPKVVQKEKIMAKKSSYKAEDEAELGSLLNKFGKK